LLCRFAYRALPFFLPAHGPRPWPVLGRTSPMGFEPTISTLTAWRALLAAPRGQCSLQWLRWDSNPQHPCDHGFAAVPEPKVVCRLPTEPCHQSAQGGSRTHKRLGLSQAALPRWRTWARVVPDGVEPSLPGCEPGVVPLDHGTVYLFVQWTHRELHSDFRRAEPTSSCWTMSPSDQSSGGWNRTNVLLVQNQESHTASDSPGVHLRFLRSSSGRRVRTSVS
jgi:hypothetical protein